MSSIASDPAEDALKLREQLGDLLGADAIISRPEELLVYVCDAYTLEKRLP